MSTIDGYAFALEAMQQVLDLVKQAPKHQTDGHGSLVCPQCKGKLSYAWHRVPKTTSRRRLTYTAICDTTPGCIKFSGH